MTVRMKIATGMGVGWVAFLCGLALLTGCTALTPGTIYEPVNVDTPVPVPCTPPDVVPPPDLIGPLKPGGTLTLGVKALAAQHEYDEGYIQQLEAALKACK